MDKEKKKIFRRKAGWVLLRVSFWLIRLLPFRFILFLGRVFGLLGYLFSVKHRRIALESLKIAFFKEKNLSELKKIARECFKFMGEEALEIFYFLNNPQEVKKKVKIEGLDRLKEALKRNKGVVALTAHFGNFPLMCLRLKEEGFSVNTMARPLRDEKAGEFIHKLRTNAGVKTIFSYPKREAVFSSLRALTRNEVLVIQMDQNYGTGGVWVKFFGRLAATPVGPIILALRSRAPIVPMFIVREAPAQHTIFIEKEASLERREDKEQTILANAIKFTKIIENWIKKYPQFWGWIHQRWKSRPSERIYNLKFKVQKD